MTDIEAMAARLLPTAIETADEYRGENREDALMAILVACLERADQLQAA